MESEDVERLIEEGLPDCTATVAPARGDHDEDHLLAVVTSPAFEGETIVDQHQLVYDAIGDAMTREIHALELTTKTPE